MSTTEKNYINALLLKRKIQDGSLVEEGGNARKEDVFIKTQNTYSSTTHFKQ